MSKKWYCISVIILIVFITGVITSTKPSHSYTSINRMINISEKPKELPIARVIIPKLGLDEVLYNPKSSENTVERNVMILEGSVFPSSNNSIIFLAAHSGEGKIAYFNDLDKLLVKDILIFQYNNYNYYYEIDKIFEEEKDGDIELNKTSNNQLVLTTCSKTNSKKQLIVNSNLLKKEKIT